MPDTGGRQLTVRYKLVLTLIIVIAVAAITVGAALLVKDIELRLGLWPVLQLLIVGIISVLSAVCANILPGALREIWQLAGLDPEQVFASLKRLRAVKRPWRVALVGVTTGALVAAGVALRPAPSDLEPGNLVIMTAAGADPGASRSIVLDQWNRLHPDNRARFVETPPDADAQHERMVDDAKPGGENQADLYVVDIVYMAEFIERGYLRPLDESTLSERDLGDFVPKVLRTCEDENGNLWALPFNSDVGLMYYRTDIPGVEAPGSWDDYFGTAAKNTVAAARNAVPGIEAANAAQLSADDEMLTVTTMEAIWAAGGLSLGTNGQPTLTSNRTAVAFGPADELALQKLAAAVSDPDVVLTTDDEAKKTTATMAAQAFAAGRTVYTRNWPVASDTIGDQVPFKAIATPTPGVLGGQNVGISASTDKPRAAQALAQFLTDASSQRILSEVGGFVPTRQSSLDNARRPDASELRIALDRAFLRPVTPCYLEFSRLLRQGIVRALNDGGRIEDGFAVQLAEKLVCR